MEYPPRDDKMWMVVAYDLKDRPMLMEQGLTQKECKRLGDEWLNRADVGRVEGKNLEVPKAKEGQEAP